MPWQERDWAKWTDEERDRYLGTSGSRGGTGGRPPGQAIGAGRRPPDRRSGLNQPLSKRQVILAFAGIAAFAAYAIHSGLKLPTRSVIERSSPAVKVAPPKRSSSPAVKVAPPKRSSLPAVKIAPPRQFPMTRFPTRLRRGTYVTSRGTLGRNVSGPVIVEGRWGRGPWYRLATANATLGTYRVRYLLDRRGFVHLRIALPDGNYLVATTRVN